MGRTKGVYVDRAVEIIGPNISRFTLRDIGTIVWSLATVGKVEPVLEVIEEEIIKKIPEATVKELAIIIWSYVQKAPLKYGTVKAIAKRVLEKQEDLDSWDLANLIWGYSKFSEFPELEDLFKGLEGSCLRLLEECSPYEFAAILRGYSEERFGSEELYEAFVKKGLATVELMNYEEVMMCLYSFVISEHVDQNKFSEVLAKLDERRKYLVSVVDTAGSKTNVGQSSGGSRVNPIEENLKSDISSVEMFLENELVEKIIEGKDLSEEELKRLKEKKEGK
jgi:hypothetical protein